MIDKFCPIKQFKIIKASGMTLEDIDGFKYVYFGDTEFVIAYSKYGENKMPLTQFELNFDTPCLMPLMGLINPQTQVFQKNEFMYVPSHSYYAGELLFNGCPQDINSKEYFDKRFE